MKQILFTPIIISVNTIITNAITIITNTGQENRIAQTKNRSGV